MTNPYLDDKRLLEALNFIDERFIAEVTEDYEIFDLPGEYKPNRKRTFRAYRQFIALAACLILLSGAFPVVIRFVSGTIDFMAGRGSGTTEKNDMIELDSPYERAIDAYPADMPADEIYVDVLKGGWVVKGESYGGLTMGEELWYSFFEKTQKGEPASVLVAHYFADVNNINGEGSIFLYEIVYDGELFYLKAFSCQEDTIFHQHEYMFLKKGEVVYTENGQTCFSEAYFLTNTDWITWKFLRPFRISSSYSPEVSFGNDYNYLIFELIYKN